tara:strand:- start:271 stop:420 length:150 start_codon:yes stop_codon:yes gene_type:complete
MGILKEFIKFILLQKKFFLIPATIILILFGALLVMTQGTVIAPFIYTLF